MYSIPFQFCSIFLLINFIFPTLQVYNTVLFAIYYCYASAREGCKRNNGYMEGNKSNYMTYVSHLKQLDGLCLLSKTARRLTPFIQNSQLTYALYPKQPDDLCLLSKTAR